MHLIRRPALLAILGATLAAPALAASALGAQQPARATAMSAPLAAEPARDSAIAKLTAFLDRYPDSPLRANALFQVGRWYKVVGAQKLSEEENLERQMISFR